MTLHHGGYEGMIKARLYKEFDDTVVEYSEDLSPVKYPEKSLRN